MVILKMEWQKNKKALLLWTLIILLVLTLFMSVFPTMETTAMKEMLATKLGGLPPNLLKIFHLNDGPSLLEPIGFFGYIFQYLFIAASIYALLLGTTALISEETDGTIEFLYAQPVSRKRIVLEKFLGNLLLLSVFWLVTFLGSLSTLSFFNHSQAGFGHLFSGLVKIILPEFFILVFFLSLGFLLSSLIPSTKQSIGFSLGIVFGFYLIGLFGDLKENLSFLKKFSPIAQGIPATLSAAPFSFVLPIILSVLSILLLILTVILYQKKDLSI